ncbi:hypothetical protein EV421DRAFT_1979294 [Armillaria borealis]|uniref:Transmembrane protein n=1 Tax=Armillaria borealis TaxID=47425 RepID=A0AA39MK93_9AGAR|nr:hypothetical protein EV421DRAFT_1979294 [Armillaria borealis]
MSTYPPHTKKIRRCFFFSLAFVIVIPIICIVLGLELHPGEEFAYNANDAISDGSTRKRKISLHADLISADLKQGTVVLDWSVWDDTCQSDCTVANDICEDECTDANDTCFSKCTVVNIYFYTNLLHHSDIGDIRPSSSNRPVVPLFIWNATASYNDTFSNIATFRTELAVFPPDDEDTKHPVRHTHSSEVYYPFDRYLVAIFGFAEDASSNATVPLSLNSTSGLAVGLKISTPFVDNVPDFAQEGDPERLSVIVSLERATSVKWYCIIITITFWLITLMICLVMIMTVGFGFQQRNEIVVVPIATMFAFTQLRSTMPGAPDGFGDILDFVGVLPCLVLLSISAVTMVGIYIFTDPAKDSREKLTWSALVNAVVRPRKAPSETVDAKNTVPGPLAESYSMLSLSKD